MLPNMEAKQPFSDQDWQATPDPVRQYIMELEQTIAMLGGCPTIHDYKKIGILKSRPDGRTSRLFRK